jgi:hypothetical protein
LEQRARAVAIDNYYAITSTFKPKSPGWAFWKYFTEIKRRSAALAAGLVFPGPNDLVVDRASMVDLGGSASRPLSIPTAKTRLKDFGVNDQVHHTNYFDFDETIEFMTSVLR